MRDNEQKFFFRGYDKLKLRLYKAFEKDRNPRIILTLEGLEHPKARECNYIGEETKNPQLKKATDIISGVFNDWVSLFSKRVARDLEIVRFRNIGFSEKEAYVKFQPQSRLFSIFNEFVFFHSAKTLARMIEAKIPDIERAIEAGKAITLTDPNVHIEHAFARAILRAAQNVNVTPQDTEAAKALLRPRSDYN